MRQPITNEIKDGRVVDGIFDQPGARSAEIIPVYYNRRLQGWVPADVSPARALVIVYPSAWLKA